MYDFLDDDFDSFGETEDIDVFDDSDLFDESARSRRLARLAKARVMARSRSRNNGRMARKPKNVREAFSKVGNDLQKVNLESKVNTDLLSGAVKSQSTRISRAETSQTLSKIWDEFRTLYPNAINDPTIKSVFSLAPLLFLKPEKKGQGFASVISDPRLWGSAAIAAFALYNKIQKKYTVTLGPASPKANAGGQVQLTILVRDSAGKPVSGQAITWASSDESLATVDSNGLVNAKKANTTPFITATVAGTNDSAAVAVEIT